MAIVLAVILMLAIVTAYFLDFTPAETKWGVTFSPYYAAEELDLDWQETYLAILTDLNVDHIRLSAYWNSIEPEQDSYNFDDLDWQINEATNRKVEMIIAVGRKLPRWPECHNPSWISDLSQEDIQSQQLEYITEVINRYKTNQRIKVWQVENEPYLKLFGECPPLDKEFLKQEIALIKELDDRPILITDSGELNSWIPAGRAGGEILGTTLYRVVYNPTFGYFKWFLPPSFYYYKAKIVKWLTPTDKVIVAELQAESWHPEDKNLTQMTEVETSKSISLEQLRSNIEFAKQAGFDEAYLWGVEWWYYMKTKNNYDNLWLEAKKLWQ